MHEVSSLKRRETLASTSTYFDYDCRRLSDTKCLSLNPVIYFSLIRFFCSLSDYRDKSRNREE